MIFTYRKRGQLTCSWYVTEIPYDINLESTKRRFDPMENETLRTSTKSLVIEGVIAVATEEFSSSNFHEGTQIATINTRFVYAMRSIGKRCRSRENVLRMNLPQPPTRFSHYGKRILNAAKLVYEDSIQNAAKEAICENEGNKNIAVAVDGTWQKRGYTSLNGVVTVNTGKVIDVDILSKYCACKNLPFHEKDCKRNYVGSSGAMEIKVRLKFSNGHYIYIMPDILRT
ncbi:uncharacterized protein TNCV_4853331 [Trichonephila clavipes]|nr:uncharacterized protein TNCV_4853331 [Trichonephila clavipes]